ncbi:hypothetical protein BJ165DRAFT_1525524 [Panaeolus papilionaceus]|nr:hypothetical protein BJ165DRAFT_1525524 [Panaeolus papilionaceus]
MTSALWFGYELISGNPGNPGSLTNASPGYPALLGTLSPPAHTQYNFCKDSDRRVDYIVSDMRKNGLQIFSFKYPREMSSHQHPLLHPSELFDMVSFLNVMIPLQCLSLCLCAGSMTFAALTININRVFWILPAAVLVTFVYHAFILVTGMSRDGRSRLFTPFYVVMAYIFASIWFLVFAGSITVICLIASNTIPGTSDIKREIFLAVFSALSLIEMSLLGFVSIRSHQEMRALQSSEFYGASEPVSTNWNIVNLPTSSRSASIIVGKEVKVAAI